MIRFRALGTEFRTHVLTLLAGSVALALGIKTELPFLAAAVFFHELMHILAALVVGIKIDYIELMWFGGAAHVRDIYSAKAGHIIITALAGPFGNLLLALIAASLAWWGILPYHPAAMMIRINILLMLFNLMPALPLDGGRVFYAVTAARLGKIRAMKVVVAMAHVLAAAGAAAAVVVWLRHRVVNVTFILMAVFLLASSLSELKNFNETSPLRIFSAIYNRTQLPSKAGLIAVGSDMLPEDMAAYIQNDSYTIFAVVENDRIRSLMTGKEVACKLMNGSGTCSPQI